MRTLLLLLSLSAVAVGQTVYTTSDGAMAASMCLNTVTNVWATCTPMPKPKPHKRKPPVKTDPRDGQYFGWRDGKKHPETLHIEGSGDPTPKGTMWYPITFADPCDGISCVGPVEMMPGKKCDDCAAAVLPQKGCRYGCEDKATLELFSTECAYTKDWSKCTHVAPDKAAVPVEPKAEFYAIAGTTSLASGFTIMSEADRCSWRGFQYDAKTKTCSMKITFDVNSQVVCTPLVLNEQGRPEMTCSFKLIDEGGK